MNDDRNTREQLTAFVLALTFGFGLLLLVFLTSGCSGNVFRVDSRFTPEQERTIANAADAWQAAGAHPIDFVWRQHTDLLDTDNVIVCPPERAAEIVYPLLHDHDYTGLTSERTDRGTRIIILVERLDAIAPGPGHTTTFASAIAHELGHYYTGPEHTRGVDDVMYYMNWNYEPQRGDVAAMGKWGGDK